MNLLKVKNLIVKLNDEKEIIKGIDFQVESAKTIAIIGESGSGKSVSMKAIAGLNKDNLKVNFDNLSYNLSKNNLQDKIQRNYLGNKIGFIFQNPINSLNPLYKVKHQVYEIVNKHQKNLTKKDKMQKVYELLKISRIKNIKVIAEKYPHQLSGGQIQRIMIAMAIANNPRLLIADEPTTALDVTVQREIMILLKKLIDERKMASIFISHDLSLIKFIADYIYIMYNGYFLEAGTKEDIFQNPKHPYTKGLLDCQIENAVKGKKIPTIKKNINYNEKSDEIFDLRDDISNAEFLNKISKFEKITDTHYLRKYV